MKKIYWCIAFLVLVMVCSANPLYKWYLTIKEGKIVYVTDGTWGNTFEEGGCFFEVTKYFKKTYGIEIKRAKSIKHLRDVKKLIVFEVYPNFAKSYKNYPKEKMVLFLWEPATMFPQNYQKKYHQYFSKVFTWDDAFVDGKQYRKLYYPQLCLKMTQERVPFEKKKLCALISRNKSSVHPDELYSKRRDAIDFFEKEAPSEFDLMGQGWAVSNYSTYKGTVKDKSCLKNYKFSICYENMKNINGYVTEKLFDSFIAGCVPVYLGATNIEKYVPKECFIPRENFASEKELYDFLVSMKEEEYQKYILAIEKFLQSDKTQFFTLQNFIRTMEEAIR